MKPFFISVICLFFLHCAKHIPSDSTMINKDVVAPDYTMLDYWAAHPDKIDPADQIPGNELKDVATTEEIDVFFVHPTTYFGSKTCKDWNADLTDEKLNKETDESTILHQASIFNVAGRVFAPRYRQAHYHAYYTTNKEVAAKVFDYAYNDVRKAFEVFLEKYNNGKPFIIASHSQGTTHSSRLIKELIDGKPLQKQMVAAYLVGMPVSEDYFETLLPCQNAEDITCYCSWRTYQKGHYPDYHIKENNFVVTNPLNWTVEGGYSPKEMNKGAVLRNFTKGIKKHLVDAQVHDGLLWVSKPKFFGSFLIRTKNFHIADYNLFYVNVRENVKQRIKAYFANFSKID